MTSSFFGFFGGNLLCSNFRCSTGYVWQENLNWIESKVPKWI
jgi:hypothetical protein